MTDSNIVYVVQGTIEFDTPNLSDEVYEELLIETEGKQQHAILRGGALDGTLVSIPAFIEIFKTTTNRPTIYLRTDEKRPILLGEDEVEAMANVFQELS